MCRHWNQSKTFLVRRSNKRMLEKNYFQFEVLHRFCIHLNNKIEIISWEYKAINDLKRLSKASSFTVRSVDIIANDFVDFFFLQNQYLSLFKDITTTTVNFHCSFTMHNTIDGYILFSTFVNGNQTCNSSGKVVLMHR